jgi:hypothetical protein
VHTSGRRLEYLRCGVGKSSRARMLTVDPYQSDNLVIADDIAEYTTRGVTIFDNVEVVSMYVRCPHNVMLAVMQNMHMKTSIMRHF